MSTTKAVNHNQISGLARLMAGENLTVTHDIKTSTASFNMKERILTLPVLEQMTGFVYHAFVAHEIGHALYTPFDEKFLTELYKKVPQDFVNITEDARIEKMVKRKYPGTIKDFYHLYQYCVAPERDYFELAKTPINERNLIDRINIQFKLGSIIKVPFEQEELQFVEMVENEVTFDDAVNAAAAIYEYMKKNNQLPKPNNTFGQQSTQGDANQKSSSMPMESESGEQPQESATQENTSPSNTPNGNTVNDDKATQDALPQNTATTQKAFDKNFKNNEVEKQSSTKDVHCGDIIQLKETTLNRMIKEGKYVSKATSTEYDSFIQDVSSTVNMLVTYFNTKKSAKDYLKTKTAKSGVLNMDKIHNYKTQSTDIFLTNEVVYESKNHGMVLFLDWSGSMKSDLKYSLKQLIVLMEFCRKAKIPFEVYGFTDNNGNIRSSEKNMVSSDLDLALFKICDSNLKLSEYKNVCSNLLNSSLSSDSIFKMSGTPITSAAFVSEYILEKFKAKYKLEKTIFILITDGSATDYISYNNSRMSTGVGSSIIMRNPATGKNYEYKNDTRDNVGWHTVFQYVKEKVGVNKMIGFYLSRKVDNSEIVNLIPNRINDIDVHKIYNDFRKDNYVELPKDIAFDKFFIVSVSKFITNEINNELNINKISTDKMKEVAISDYLTKKSKNMIFLKKFIDEIS